jgi:uncharacterized membrane protein YheB (UPF0754 family)
MANLSPAMLDFGTLWLYGAPPLVGGVIGYFTNDIAIRMLFRPYRPVYVGTRRMPFTPGLIPRNQERLATRISDTIMGSLLTPDELQKLAQRLLETDRVRAAIRWLLQLSLDQVQAGSRQRTTEVLANILRDIFGQSLPKILKSLAQREDFLEAQINQVFDQVLLDLQLNQTQATQVVDWSFDTLLPPDTLRAVLVDFLTDRNIQILDEDFRAKTSGTYWVVANLFGVRNALARLRLFCLEERPRANERIRELLEDLEVRQRLIELLQNMSLQNLPVGTVRQLRKTVQETVRLYMQDKGADFLEEFGQTINWDNVAKLLLERLQTSTAVVESLDPISLDLALILERYLEKDLEAIVEKAIPILNIDQVIINRVKATSPADLEAGINGIVKSELQAIVNLGGVLGFVIGLIQSASLLIR